METENLLLRSLRKEKIERFPVWLMRQAGRYMPEYRKLRDREKDFLSFCKNVELAIRVSLLPIEILDVDAIIIFSDILVPLESIGIDVKFLEGEGPRLEWDKNPHSLKKFNPNDVDFVFQIIKGVKEIQSKVPVIGFCGAPYTLTAYAIEGSGSKNFKNTKVFMWDKEEEFKTIMGSITKALKVYVEYQIKAGADVIQIFDSWLDSLPVTEFETIVKPSLEDLMKYIKNNYSIPLIYFFRGSSAYIDMVQDLPCDAVSVDWSVDIRKLATKTEKVIQGNLDPSVIYASEETIRKETLKLLKSVPRKTGYIFNLGHGLAPDMCQEKVKLLVDTVKSFKICN